MEDKKVTTRQMILLLTTFRMTLVISYMPSLRLPPYDQDIWIMILVSFIYTILMRIPLLYLANKFSELSLIEYIKKIWGRFMGTAVGITYVLYFAAYAIVIIVLQVQMVGSDILPRTPFWMSLLILVIVSLYIGSKGLVMLCWFMELIAPMILTSIFALIILGLKNFDIHILQPILIDSTFYEINYGAFIFSFLLTDIFVLIMSVPHLENKKDINKIFIKSVAYSLFINVIIVAVTHGALGIEQSKHANYPFLIYTRLINYSSVFERIDAIYVIIWLSANIVIKSFYIFILYTVFKEVFNLKDHKIVHYTLGVIVGLVAFYFANTQVLVLNKVHDMFIIYTSIIFVMIIPLLTMLVYLFRRKAIDKQEKVEN